MQTWCGGSSLGDTGARLQKERLQSHLKARSDKKVAVSKWDTLRERTIRKEGLKCEFNGGTLRGTDTEPETGGKS